MHALTDCADQAVILPLTLAVGVGLLLLGWRRGALAWGAAVGATLGTMLILKLAAISCGWHMLGLALDSPSGDTAAATMVYGGLAGMMAPRRTPLAVKLAAALLVAVLFGRALVAMTVHTVADVLVGGAVGLAGIWLHAALAGELPAGRLPRARGLIVGAVLLVNLAQHGRHLEAEPVIGQLAACHGAPASP